MASRRTDRRSPTRNVGSFLIWALSAGPETSHPLCRNTWLARPPLVQLQLNRSPTHEIGSYHA